MTEAEAESRSDERRVMSAGRRTFASDNWSGIHPTVLAAIVAANEGRDHAPSYGADPVTAEAIGLFHRHFGDDAEVFFAFNGTGANVVGLQSLLRPFEAVICADTAHINVDECGAPERHLGSKLIAVPTRDGKLTPDLVEAAALGTGDEHHVQPRVVSITQSTEVGTCYRVDEIAALGRWAHDRGMWLHLDGARLSNAAASLGVGLGAFGSEAGVDVLSFGATKNGAMGAEAVISFQPAEESSLRYIRKQSMQLASKMRFVSAQFAALLSDDLWRSNAAHANRMATRLADGVARIEGVRVAYPVEANAVFAAIPPDVTEALQPRYPFYVWDETAHVVRWMASFDTTERDVDDFIGAVAELMGSRQVSPS
jgi:threonine aldolase